MLLVSRAFVWLQFKFTSELRDVFSDKKATEIPSDLLTASAQSRVTVANFSRNCLIAVPAQLVLQ